MSVLQLKKQKAKEFKSISLSPTDVDVNTGIVTGYFSAFGNIDSHGDRIMPGAFKKTIRERGPKGTNQIKHLLQHDMERPLGAIQLLKEDSIGLYFETKFTVGITEVDDTLRRYEAGIYNEHSIGFRLIDGEFIDDDPTTGPHFEMTEIKLFEGSTVTLGANSQTPFTGFKGSGLSPEQYVKSFAKRVERMNAALKVKGQSDEAYKSIEEFLSLLPHEFKQFINTLSAPAGAQNHHTSIVPESEATTDKAKVEKTDWASIADLIQIDNNGRTRKSGIARKTG